MELAYSEISLVLAMTFGLSGAATYGFLLLLLRAEVDGRRLRNVDMLSPIPALAMVLSLPALFMAWANPTPAVLIAMELSPLLLGACLGSLIVSVVASGSYALLSLGNKVTKRSRTALTFFAGVGGLAYVVLVSCAHFCAPVPSWCWAAVLAAVLGASFVSGIALFAALAENAGVSLSKALKRVVTAISLFGLLAAALGFAYQVVASSRWCATMAFGSAFEHAVSDNVVVGLFCLVASSVFCVLGIRSKDKGFYSVIAVACSFVALFCLFLVLYTALPL